MKKGQAEKQCGIRAGFPALFYDEEALYLKIQFYCVSDEYIDFIKQYEKNKRGFTCVPNLKYANKDKFIYGSVLTVNGIPYFVPVSSKSNKNQQYNLNIKIDKVMIPFTGSLRFQYMIPVPNSCLINLKKNEHFQNADSLYKALVSKELAFCRRNKDKIEKMAQKTYDDFCNKKVGKLENNFCDFKLLEEAYREFCGLTAPKQDRPSEERKSEQTEVVNSDHTEITDSLEAVKAERDRAVAGCNKMAETINRTNAILNANPKLKADFVEAKKKFEKAEEKSKGKQVPDTPPKPKKPKR